MVAAFNVRADEAKWKERGKKDGKGGVCGCLSIQILYKYCTLLEVDTVPGAMVDAQLADTLPYRLNVPRQTIGQPKDARCNQGFATLITELALPLSVGIRLFDIKHELTVVLRLQKRKAKKDVRTR
jgi:hypothetical protein